MKMEKNESFKATWKLELDGLSERYGHSSVLIEDFIVTFGGADGDDNAFDDVVVYDIKQNKCRTIQSSSDIIASRRECHSSCHYKELTQVIFGGVNYNSVLKDTALLTLDTESSSYKWEVVPTTRGESLYRFSHTANIHKNKMYVFGGRDKSNNNTNELWCLDLDSFAWEKCKPTGITPEKRDRHCSVLHNEKIYYFGGYSTQKRGHLNDFLMLSLEDMHWEKIASSGTLPTPRGGASLNLKGDNFYLFGGSTDKCDLTVLNDTFVYDLNTNIWTKLNTTDDTPSGRNLHTSIIYQNCLFVWGGDSQTESTNSEIYSLKLNSEKQTKNAVNGSLDKFFFQMEEFLFSKEYSDIIFEVEGQEIPANKNFLSIRCNYFLKMFTSGMMESHEKRIKVPNVKAVTFKALLEFLYLNKIILNEELATDLLMLCDEYSLHELKDLCEKFLCSHITLKNLVTIAKFAKKFELQLLHDATLKYIRNNLRLIQTRKDFSSLPKTFFIELSVELYEAKSSL